MTNRPFVVLIVYSRIYLIIVIFESTFITTFNIMTVLAVIKTNKYNIPNYVIMVIIKSGFIFNYFTY